VTQSRRIAVVGTSGSGKSTLARRIGVALGLPVVELDAINWQPGWRGLNEHDPELFRARVAEAISGESWVTDGNYSDVRAMILARMTDLVWLDYSRAVVMARVIRRSFARATSHREIWPGTGNMERFSNWLDPEHPIRWAWSTHHKRRERYGALARSQPPGVIVHHLRHPRDADRLLERLRAAGTSGSVPEPLAG
jgi:adenylate kinase family enzyme